MSVIKISITAATLIMSTAALAESPNRIYSAGDNSYASKLCVVAATGNRFQVTDQIKALKPTTHIKKIIVMSSIKLPVTGLILSLLQLMRAIMGSLKN